MDSVHFHLLITHLPVLGVLFGTLILIWSLIKKNQDILKVGLFTLVLASLLTVPTYFSGENSEEKVEHLAGVSERIIEEHDEAAKIALGLAGLLGVLSLGALFLKTSPKTQTAMVSGIIVVGLVTNGAMAKTANLGGQIRHSEIRSGNNFSNNEGKEENEKEESEEKKSKNESSNLIKKEDIKENKLNEKKELKNNSKKDKDNDGDND